jgi:hypothetical protein
LGNLELPEGSWRHLLVIDHQHMSLAGSTPLTKRFSKEGNTIESDDQTLYRGVYCEHMPICMASSSATQSHRAAVLASHRRLRYSAAPFLCSLKSFSQMSSTNTVQKMVGEFGARAYEHWAHSASDHLEVPYHPLLSLVEKAG